MPDPTTGPAPDHVVRADDAAVLGVVVRTLAGPAELSAHGLGEPGGVAVLDTTDVGRGLAAGDVILAFAGCAQMDLGLGPLGPLGAGCQVAQPVRARPRPVVRGGGWS